MAGEAVAAILLGLGVLWLLLHPLLAGPRAPRLPAFEEPEELEETRRGIALLALKEIDFDRATGKLSEADYHDLRARYTEEALAALREEGPPVPAALPAHATPPSGPAGSAPHFTAPAGSPPHLTAPAGAGGDGVGGDSLGEADLIERLVAARVKDLGTAAACPRCGPRPEAGARFCSSCGGTLGVALCGACGHPLAAGSRYCGECGAAAAA